MMSKRFHTYFGREMRDRLLEYPYLKGSEFRSLPLYSSHANSRRRDIRFINSFLCMSFYIYSDVPMPCFEPTGNSIRNIIHRNNDCMEHTRMLFFDQVFSYPRSSPQLRLLRLLIRSFGQIGLHNFKRPLVEQEGFDHALYIRMVYQCYPDAYAVENETVASYLNHHHVKKKSGKD